MDFFTIAIRYVEYLSSGIIIISIPIDIFDLVELISIEKNDVPSRSVPYPTSPSNRYTTLLIVITTHDGEGLFQCKFLSITNHIDLFLSATFLTPGLKATDNHVHELRIQLYASTYTVGLAACD